jgi:hypothetical protein
VEDHRPIPNCYWVEPGRLLAGEYPGAPDEATARRRLRQFLAAGLTYFLDLTQEGEPGPYARLLSDEAAAAGVAVAHRRAPIRDFGVPTHSEMAGILDAIDDALAAGHVVYVHCWGGVGRTGTVVGCYLARRGLNGDDALRQLAQWWTVMEKRGRHPRSPETPEQEAFVRSWREPRPG